MSSSEDIDEAETRTQEGRAVFDYLRDNPDFFNEFSGVLHEIEIPHLNGEAISLFDRQVSALREENRRLKSTLEQLIENARTNEGLISRIHELALGLMEVAGPKAIFSTLDSRLVRDFSADKSRVIVFAEPGFVESNGVDEFVGNEDERARAFSAIFDASEPWCGQLDSDMASVLWAEQALSGSVALLPLMGKSWRGVLAIYSKDSNRFEADMSTEFLKYIGDITTLILDPWVAK